MGLLFLAVCSVFGLLAIVLWAGLASARVKLRHAEELAADMLAAIEKADLSQPERAALALRYTMVFGERARPVANDPARS